MSTKSSQSREQLGDPEDHLEEEVQRALREYVALASISPIMSEAIRAEYLEPDIVPASPKMGALVYAAADQSAEVLGRKRKGHGCVPPDNNENRLPFGRDA